MSFGSINSTRTVRVNEQNIDRLECDRLLFLRITCEGQQWPNSLRCKLIFSGHPSTTVQGYF